MPQLASQGSVADSRKPSQFALSLTALWYLMISSNGWGKCDLMEEFPGLYRREFWQGLVFIKWEVVSFVYLINLSGQSQPSKKKSQKKMLGVWIIRVVLHVCMFPYLFFSFFLNFFVIFFYFENLKPNCRCHGINISLWLTITYSNRQLHPRQDGGIEYILFVVFFNW